LPGQPEGDADNDEGVEAMEAGDGGKVRMLKADEGKGKLEDEKEKKQGGEQGRLPGMAGGEREKDEDEDGGRNEQGTVEAMERREGVVGGVVGGKREGERGGDGDDSGGDEVELGTEFDEEKDAQGRICLSEETGASRSGECG
jgi:hypothetical protein